jgi:competence protein ComGC
MAGLIDAGIIKPELAGSFAAGYQQAGQARQQSEMNQLKLDQLKQDRAAMMQLQERLKAAGQDPDLDKVFDALISTGNPDYVTKGLEGKQRLKDQREYARIMGYDQAAPTAAPAAPAAPVNALVAGPDQSQAEVNRLMGTAPAAPAAAPVNALVPAVRAGAAPAPVTAGAPAPVNALAAQNQALVAQTQDRINNLMRFAATASPQMANNAMAQVRVLQDQLELYSKPSRAQPAALQELEAYMAMTPEQKAAFEKLQKIKTPSTNVAVNAPVAKSLAGPVGQRAEASLAKAEGATGMMDSANMVREALNSGNVIAGPLAGPRLKFAQVLDMAGAGDKDKLVNTRTAIQGLATLTLESRAELKGQGQVTENEQKLLERARSGNIEDMTISELQQVVNISQRLAGRLWSNHQTLLKTMETDPAAADSLRYYRPTGELPKPVGEGKPQAKVDERKAGLDQIFGGKR